MGKCQDFVISRAPESKLGALIRLPFNLTRQLYPEKRKGEVRLLSTYRMPEQV